MQSKGFNQSSLSQSLNVSREAVSRWLKGASFPKPDKLLRLGMLLGLSFTELVSTDSSKEPVVAFRKRQGTKTRDNDFLRFKQMGRYLEELTPFLPYNGLSRPPVLKKPVTDYDYLQEVSAMVRREIMVEPDVAIDFQHLIRYFSKIQAVLIPVMWGQKERHENATHVYLPQSMTTWIYLNLDVNIHDFKFWMAHELGHALAPDLRGEDGEDFADAFAGSLLFPDVVAKKCYDELTGKTVGKQVNILKRWAMDYVLSPTTIFLQVQAYARHHGLPPLPMDNIHAANTNFHKLHKNLAERLMPEQPTKPTDYIKLVTEQFSSPVFTALSAYLRENEKSYGFVKTVLDIPLIDAKTLYSELT